MSKTLGATLMAGVLLLGSAVPSYADGHHPPARPAPHSAAWHPRAPHVIVAPRVYVGPRPYYWGYGYPAVVIPPVPPAYLEPAPPLASLWYYCPNPSGYYPYVQMCPSGWITVPAGG